MSDTVLYWSLFGVFVFFGAIAVYIIVGTKKARTGRQAYRWEPEQDYDVVQTGEANMTPAFPVLKKRKRTTENQHSKPPSNR